MLTATKSSADTRLPEVRMMSAWVQGLRDKQYELEKAEARLRKRLGKARYMELLKEREWERKQKLQEQFEMELERQNELRQEQEDPDFGSAKKKTPKKLVRHGRVGNLYVAPKKSVEVVIADKVCGWVGVRAWRCVWGV